jgi:hypothetical protein
LFTHIWILHGTDFRRSCVRRCQDARGAKKDTSNALRKAVSSKDDHK